MPPEVKELVEKHESSGTRQITKDLHSATTMLGRAQRALKDAQQQRQTHRNAWLAHLTESMQLWESQLEEFKRRQMALREAEQKASQDIASARSTIQQLNQTSGTGQANTSSCCEVDVPVGCTGVNANGEGVSCDGHGADGVDDGGA